MHSTGDPFAVMLARIASAEPSMRWRPDDADWPARARGALSAAIGVVDKAWTTVGFDPGDEVEEDGYCRTPVVFPSHGTWTGRGWLLVPNGVASPAPAVVCLPGHGKGAVAIVGLEPEPYQAEFALQCVREGWVTLAVEQVSFGSNRSSRDAENQSSCVIDSMAALLLGETITGWRVRDAMAARRALETLDFVDASRIGVMGISGGGLTALWAAALDEEFLAAGISGYFCPIIHSILATYHCPDNYVPGFAKLMDVPDLAGLVSPRWLAVEGGTRDPLFRSEGFEQACSLATDIYRRAPERFARDLFEGEHVFNGHVIFELFRKAFG